MIRYLHPAYHPAKYTAIWDGSYSHKIIIYFMYHAYIAPRVKRSCLWYVNKLLRQKLPKFQTYQKGNYASYTCTRVLGELLVAGVQFQRGLYLVVSVRQWHIFISIMIILLQDPPRTLMYRCNSGIFINYIWHAENVR